MTDEAIQGMVIRSIQNAERRQPEVQYTRCRVPECNRQANGLDGFCRPCSSEREREGKWETPRLEEQR